MGSLKFKTPCSDCPFRRNATPGWLGASEPEWFVESALADYTAYGDAPCHQTIDYEAPGWEAQLHEGAVCVGAVIFAKNLGKMPHDPRRAEMVRSVEVDREGVFASPDEFIDYHRNAAVRSWERSSA